MSIQSITLTQKPTPNPESLLTKESYSV